MELGGHKVDKGAVGRRFGASAASYDRSALAQQHIYSVLEAMLARLARHAFDRVLEIGSGTGGFARYIDDRYQVAHWTLNDLSEAMLRHNDFRPRSGLSADLIVGDAEEVELGGGYDLIISASAMQWFHAPEVFLSSLRHRLTPGGVLLVSTFGGDNLTEIRQLTGRGLDYPALDALERWLTPFSHYELSEELYPLHFATPREILLHLKHTGVTAVGSSEGFWTAERLRSFEQNYQELFQESDGSLRLTYHPIYMMAW